MLSYENPFLFLGRDHPLKSRLKGTNDMPQQVWLRESFFLSTIYQSATENKRQRESYVCDFIINQVRMTSQGIFSPLLLLLLRPSTHLGTHPHPHTNTHTHPFPLLLPHHLYSQLQAWKWIENGNKKNEKPRDHPHVRSHHWNVNDSPEAPVLFFFLFLRSEWLPLYFPHPFYFILFILFYFSSPPPLSTLQYVTTVTGTHSFHSFIHLLY